MPIIATQIDNALNSTSVYAAASASSPTKTASPQAYVRLLARPSLWNGALSNIEVRPAHAPSQRLSRASNSASEASNMGPQVPRRPCASSRSSATVTTVAWRARSTSWLMGCAAATERCSATLLFRSSRCPTSSVAAAQVDTVNVTLHSNGRGFTATSFLLEASK